MIAFDNTYARLPSRFYAPILPTKVREPRIIRLNAGLAKTLGIDVADLTAEVLSGNATPDGAEPIALAYAGHQFGSFAGRLGDGRAILLGEVVGTDGKRRDIQLKDAGRTPFSRGGDGRAAIGPVVREYILSEAMFALGVPTTRALAAVTTGEPVVREETQPGAVLTRVAASHIRVGTFELYASGDDREALSVLALYALRRHYPQAGGTNAGLMLLTNVIEAQARLVAQWLGVGFVHGVMNTDNTAISGETIDYGPCAFLDEYDPNKTFSAIDRHGRYGFSSQPRIAQWNMAKLAEALLPILDDDEPTAIRLATEQVNRFPALFEKAHARVLRAKLGLEREEEDDLALASDLFQGLAKHGVDHTLFFRKLSSGSIDAGFEDWAAAWRRRLAAEGSTPESRADAMCRVNPAFIPRNHRVEQVIQAAVRDDFVPLERLVRVLERPYDDQPELADLAEAPTVDKRVRRTFCGT